MFFPHCTHQAQPGLRTSKTSFFSTRLLTRVKLEGDPEAKTNFSSCTHTFLIIAGD